MNGETVQESVKTGASIGLALSGFLALVLCENISSTDDLISVAVLLLGLPILGGLGGFIWGLILVASHKVGDEIENVGCQRIITLAASIAGIVSCLMAALQFCSRR